MSGDFTGPVVGHRRLVAPVPGWGMDAWQSLCECGFESRPEQSRPEAVRAHVLHSAPYRLVPSW